MTPQPTHFSIIPSNVLYHKTLSPSAKLLYAQITGLIGERGYCWASNAFFAERNNCSEWTISNLISQLRDEGFLRVEIDKRAGNQRHIYTAETLPLLRKNQRGYSEKSQYPIEKNPNTLLRKTPSRVIKESKINGVVEVSGENAHAQPNQSSPIQGERHTSMPSSGPAPHLFSDSVWVSETAEAWRVALVAETGIEDLNGVWYFNRVKDWSAEKAAKSANWIATAAKFVRDDQRKNKLVTINNATDDTARHTILVNPITGNTTNLQRVTDATKAARRVMEKWAKAS